MNQSYSRISENVLFAAVLAVVIGSSALSVASHQPAASTPATVAAATQTSNS